MTISKSIKAISIESNQYEAAIELEKYHDPINTTVTIKITITIDQIIYRFEGPINDIIDHLPSTVKNMIIDNPSIIFEYLESNDYDIAFVPYDYKTLLISFKLAIGKQSYDIVIHCVTDNVHVLYSLALSRIDELDTELGNMRVVDEYRAHQVETLQDEKRRLEMVIGELNVKLETMKTENDIKDGRIETLQYDTKKLGLMIDGLNAKYDKLNQSIVEKNDRMYDYSQIQKIEFVLPIYVNNSEYASGDTSRLNYECILRFKKTVPNEFIFFFHKFVDNGPYFEENIWITNYGKILIISFTSGLNNRNIHCVKSKEYEFFIPVDNINTFSIPCEYGSSLCGTKVGTPARSRSGPVFKYIEGIKNMVGK